MTELVLQAELREERQFMRLRDPKIGTARRGVWAWEVIRPLNAHDFVEGLHRDTDP